MFKKGVGTGWLRLGKRAVDHHTQSSLSSLFFSFTMHINVQF